jgi:hypothetical protein
MLQAITTMRDRTRKLLARAKQENDKECKERPSVDELREQGKILSLTDLAKVCQKQVSQH